MITTTKTSWWWHVWCVETCSRTCNMWRIHLVHVKSVLRTKYTTNVRRTHGPSDGGLQASRTLDLEGTVVEQKRHEFLHLYCYIQTFPSAINSLISTPEPYRRVKYSDSKSLWKVLLECLFVYQWEEARQVETGNDLSRLSPSCPGHNNGTQSRLSAPSQKSRLPLSFLSAEPLSVALGEDRCGSEG